jgi:D-alanine-D-alanine ligase and related ATP-grasp enzymes
MKILVLHSDVPPDAPPEDQDTLIAARAIAGALVSRGHTAPLASFVNDREALRKLVTPHRPDVVFNLVEGIEGKGQLAYLAPQMLAEIGVPFTGAGARSLILTGDKPRTKTMLRDAGLPTPAWVEPPQWNGLGAGRWIVKCADEDASVGLDDGAVVEAPEVEARAAACTAKFGGRWFAEEFIDGREFNIAIIEQAGEPHILPMAEMMFVGWPVERPRIVGYNAKWDEASFESVKTVRRFGVEYREPALARELRFLCEECWELFACRGTARVDFRVDMDGRPQILEINPNPGIAPDAGLIAAAYEAGLSYADLVEGIVREAVR